MIPNDVFEDVLLFDAGNKFIKGLLDAHLNSERVQTLLYHKHFMGTKKLEDYNNPMQFVSVNIMRVTHRVLSVYWKKNKLYGLVEIIKNTNDGKVLCDLMYSDPSKVIWFPRMLGSRDKDGHINNIVTFVTFDWKISE